MGQRDQKIKTFFSDPVRFADLINGICFQGEQKIRPEDLSEVDPVNKERTRDIVRKVAFNTEFVIIGIESQETIDYSMAVRVLESDLENCCIDIQRMQNSIRLQQLS